MRVAEEMTGQVKAMWMDAMEDTRVYMEIDGYEVEIHTDLILEKDGQWTSLGTVMEGPDMGEEITIGHDLCLIAMAKYEKECEEREWE